MGTASQIYEHDLYLVFSWHLIYCSSLLLTEWREPQPFVWHFEESHSTTAALCVQSNLRRFSLELSLKVAKSQTITYEHKQISVTHLAKLPTYNCRQPVCSNMFFYFFFFKDERYWSRRCKNNEAAKRSRDARRLKENQISVRASFLERENAALRQEVADMRKELGRCRNILNKYESHHMDQ